MANRNRNAGLSWERTVYQTLNQRTIKSIGKEITNKELRDLDDSLFVLFPKLGSTRELSRALDARKVDITTMTPERIREFPYNIQAKTLSTSTAPYPKLLAESRAANINGTPVVFHQQTKKVGTRFMVQDEFALLYLNDFIDMMFRIAELEFELKQKEHFEK